jgi:hypothetical protein
LFLSLIFAGFCWGDQIITITNPNYNNTTTHDYYNSSSDPNGAMGDSALSAWQNYDIESAKIDVSGTGSGMTATLTLLFNYGQDASTTAGKNAYATLGSFDDKNYTSTPLNVGDVFFFDPASPTPNFGISLVSRNTLTQGNLYTIVPGGTQTASQEVGSVAGRPPIPVQMTSADYSASPAAKGSEVINQTLVGSAVQVTVTLTNLTSAAQTLFSGGNFGFEFASTDCANDVLTNAPEPSSICLAFGGLLLAGIGLIRRKRSV